MKLMGMIITFVALEAALLAQPTGSYEKLKGTGLRQLLRTHGASRTGRLVALTIPASALPVREKTRGAWVRFQYKGLTMEVRTANAYWIQTARKLRKSSSGKVILKGQVRRVPGRNGKVKHCLRIHSLQKTSSGREKKRKR